MPPQSSQSWPATHTAHDYTWWLDDFMGLPADAPSIIRRPGTAVPIDTILCSAAESYICQLRDIYALPDIRAPPAGPAPAALTLELATLLLTFIHALPDNNRCGIMPLTFNQHAALSLLRSEATTTPIDLERLLRHTHRACLALFQSHQSGQTTSHLIQSYSLVRRSFGASSREISSHLTWLTRAIIFAEIRRTAELL